MGRLILRSFVGLVFIFLILPIVTVVVSSFSSSPVLAFPPSGLTLDWYRRISPEFYDAMKVSILVGLGTTVVATLVGTPAALALVRGRIPGKILFNAFCLSPLMVSTLVIGVAAFQYTLTIWDLTGLSLAGTYGGLILAQSAFTIPFVIRAAIAGQAHFDVSIEEAARSLGATPMQTFFRVTLPILSPGIASGAISAFLMSLDAVPIAHFIGGAYISTPTL
jgi:putative spermidine/putrescine transport system permease protein